MNRIEVVPSHRSATLKLSEEVEPDEHVTSVNYRVITCLTHDGFCDEQVYAAERNVSFSVVSTEGIPASTLTESLGTRMVVVYVFHR